MKINLTEIRRIKVRNMTFNKYYEMYFDFKGCDEVLLIHEGIKSIIPLKEAQRLVRIWVNCKINEIIYLSTF